MTLSLFLVRPAVKGGPGSGNFGHAGRPGEVGGSAPKGAAALQEDGVASEVKSERSYKPGQDRPVEDFAQTESLLGYLNRFEMTPSTQNDPVLAEILHEQGFDGLPQVVSKSEFDQLVESGEIETVLFRGVAPAGDGKLTAQEMVDQFKNADLFVGKGIFGNGTYSSKREGLAREYAGNSGQVMRIGVRKGAKAISVDDLDDLISERNKLSPPILMVTSQMHNGFNGRRYGSQYDESHFRFRGHDQKSASESVADYIASDPGRYAAARGYDLYYNRDRDWVILNRTALYVQDEPV